MVSLWYLYGIFMVFIWYLHRRKSGRTSVYHTSIRHTKSPLIAQRACYYVICQKDLLISQR